MEQSNPGYDASLKEVEEILHKLEKGDVGIDEISKLVKRASFLLGNCQTQLRIIEKDIQSNFEKD